MQRPVDGRILVRMSVGESYLWLEWGKRVIDRFLWGAAGAGHGESIVTVGANVLSFSVEVVPTLL